jgi:ATP-binding cassette subfamily B protein
VSELKSLNPYLIRYKWYLLLGTIFIIASNLFAILPAQMVREAFDLVIETIQLYDLFNDSVIEPSLYELFSGSILTAGLGILLFALIRGIFLFFTRQTIIVMSRKIEYDLKNDIYQHYQSLPISFYRRNSTGDLIARISEDVSKVRMYLGPAIMYGINLITLFMLVIPYMFTVNVKLSLFSLLPLPLLSVSIYYVNNIINRRSQEIQKSLAGLSTFVQEAFSGIRVIKAFAQEKNSSSQFETQSEDYRNKSINLAFVHALFYPLMLGLIGLSTVLTIFIGGTEVIAGTITTGNIAEFVIYVNLLTWPVTALGWVTSIIQQASASQQRINEFLNTPNDIISKKNDQTPIQGHLVFDSVGFTYPDSGIEALKNISFEIHPGESIAVIGTTGSGKSTMANLICRLFDPSKGKISMDGKDLRDYNIQHLRSHIGYVPQDVFLFSDSIKSNIAFGNIELGQQEIEAAAMDADLFDNVKGFPKGFNTVVGERGITLSGGQKQRVSIARAIARKPEVLILDDCLSAVDTKTENKILNNLKRIMKGRTTIIISHRVSSAKLADKILVIEDGEIIETGSHEQLLDHPGIYRDLYEKQLKADEMIET